MTGRLLYSSIKLIFIDLIADILYWPIWWYSKGLVKTALFCFGEIKDQEQRLGISIWIKNIFTPMYGQYDIEGRLISFFIRLIQIIVRSALLLIWVIFMLLLFLVYLILPIAIIYQIIESVF